MQMPLIWCIYRHNAIFVLYWLGHRMMCDATNTPYKTNFFGPFAADMFAITTHRTCVRRSLFNVFEWMAYIAVGDKKWLVMRYIDSLEIVGTHTHILARSAANRIYFKHTSARICGGMNQSKWVRLVTGTHRRRCNGICCERYERILCKWTKDGENRTISAQNPAMSGESPENGIHWNAFVMFWFLLSTHTSMRHLFAFFSSIECLHYESCVYICSSCAVNVLCCMFDCVSMYVHVLVRTSMSSKMNVNGNIYFIPFYWDLYLCLSRRGHTCTGDSFYWLSFQWSGRFRFAKSMDWKRIKMLWTVW